MRRTTTFARGSHVRGAFLNALQDEQVGLVPASENPAGTIALKGSDGRYVATPDAGIAHNTLAVLDDSIDWRARLLRGVFIRLESAAQRLHGADAWQANDPARPIAVKLFEGGRTGTGGLGAASAAVANGTPPVVAAGSFAVVVYEGATSALRAYLYAAADGSLCLYNASGATLHAELTVWGAAVAPNPSAPPPDVLPTLTEVQWLTPALAAARPADPGGPSIFRATDTGDLSLWDGGAWRAVGGGGSSPLITNGDLYMRAGGVNARLAVGSTPQYLGVSSGLPAWKSFPWATHTSTGVQTTDATQTTCGSYTVPAGAYTAKLLVTAAKSDLSTACGWEITVTVVNNAGAVSIVGGGAIIVGPTDGATTWSVTVDVSGTSLRLRVTGAAATTIDWTARWIVG